MNEELLLQQLLHNGSSQGFLDQLESARGRGRNDYPVDLLWKGLLVQFAQKMPSIAQLRRFMAERKDLFAKVPSSSSFSRFLLALDHCSSLIEPMGLKNLHEIAPPFGEMWAIGTWGPIHFLWEPQHLFPLLCTLSQEGESAEKIATRLIERFLALNEALFRRAHYLLADASYVGLIRDAWSLWKLRPIIPLPSSSSPKLQPLQEAHYDEQGTLFCSLKPNKAMVYAGFEEKRETLKYRCMARHYSTQCEKAASCSLRSGLRVPLSINAEIFTPLPRSCYRWKQLFVHYESKGQVISTLESYGRGAQSIFRKLLTFRILTLTNIAHFFDQSLRTSSGK